MRREDEEHNRRQGERIILWKGITQQIRAFHVDIYSCSDWGFLY